MQPPGGGQQPQQPGGMQSQQPGAAGMQRSPQMDPLQMLLGLVTGRISPGGMPGGQKGPSPAGGLMGGQPGGMQNQPGGNPVRVMPGGQLVGGKGDVNPLMMHSQGAGAQQSPGPAIPPGGAPPPPRPQPTATTPETATPQTDVWRDHMQDYPGDRAGADAAVKEYDVAHPPATTTDPAKPTMDTPVPPPAAPVPGSAKPTPAPSDQATTDRANSLLTAIRKFAPTGQPNSTLEIAQSLAANRDPVQGGRGAGAPYVPPGDTQPPEGYQGAGLNPFTNNPFGNPLNAVPKWGMPSQTASTAPPATMPEPYQFKPAGAPSASPGAPSQSAPFDPQAALRARDGFDAAPPISALNAAPSPRPRPSSGRVGDNFLDQPGAKNQVAGPGVPSNLTPAAPSRATPLIDKPVTPLPSRPADSTAPVGGRSAFAGRSEPPAPGRDTPAASGIPAEGAKLLNALSGPESGRGGKGYNVLFGGGTFSSYAQHPWEGRHAPGGHSDSGKYQFTLSTWHEAQRALGLKDFSPASQDKAAWWLAQRDYQRNTGHNLQSDLKSGAFNPRGLQNTWVSIKNLGADKWAREYYNGPRPPLHQAMVAMVAMVAVEAAPRHQAARHRLPRQRLLARVRILHPFWRSIWLVRAVNNRVAVSKVAVSKALARAARRSISQMPPILRP
jgi:muramidase (phage lysozyme)